MKFDRIVAFGDSWIYGDELLDPQLLAQDPKAHTCFVQNDAYRLAHCFAGVLAQRLGAELDNFGFPGSSMQSAVWNLLWWLDNRDPSQRCLVLFGLTEANRTSFYNPEHRSFSNDPPWNRHVHSAWVHAGASAVPREWHKMVQQHWTLTDCPQTRQLNYQQTVMSVDGIALRQGLDLVMFNIMPPPRSVTVPSLAWPDQDLDRWLTSRGEGLRCADGHPNELGHVMIADLLQKHIDDAILAR